MAAVSRKNVSQAIAQLMPRIIQGAHLGFLARQTTITQTQFLVLIAIHSNQRCPMKTLAGNMQVSMPTVSGVVERLVKAGYVRRVSSIEDRRQVVVELTPKGEALIKKFKTVMSRRWEEVLGLLAPGEVEDFYHVVLKLNQHLNMVIKNDFS